VGGSKQFPILANLGLLLPKKKKKTRARRGGSTIMQGRRLHSHFHQIRGPSFCLVGGEKGGRLSSGKKFPSARLEEFFSSRKKKRSAIIHRTWDRGKRQAVRAEKISDTNALSPKKGALFYNWKKLRDSTRGKRGAAVIPVKKSRIPPEKAAPTAAERVNVSFTLLGKWGGT